MIELIDAVKKGDVEAVRALLAEGADVHGWNEEALCLAAYLGHTEIARLLLAAGADVHAKSELALSWAAAKGNVNLVKVLIGAGSVVYPVPGYALSCAVRNKDVATLQALVNTDNVFDAGADHSYHRFFGLCLGDRLIVATSRHWFTLVEARAYWEHKPDALALVERIAEWARAHERSIQGNAP